MGFRTGSYKPGQKAQAFFSQVGAGRTQASQDVLAQGQALKGVEAAGTAARTQEAERVGGKTQEVAKTDVSYGDQDQTKSVGQAVTQGTAPVVIPKTDTSSFQAATTAGPSKTVTGTASKNSTTKSVSESIAQKGLDAKKNEQLKNALINLNLAKFDTEADKQLAIQKTLADAGVTVSAEEAADLARKENLDQMLAGLEQTAKQNKYGQVGEANQQDLEAQAFLQQLAEKDPSNIGLLSSLYGGGFDAQKYGALESNILQGQLNKLREGAEGQIQDRETSEAAAQQSLKDYYSATGKKKEDISKGYETEVAKTKQLKDDIAKAKDNVIKNLADLEAAKGKAGPEMRAQIQAKIDQKKVELDKLNAAAVKAGQGRVDAGARDAANKEDEKKQKELSAKLRNKLGLELNPAKLAELSATAGKEFISALDKGDYSTALNKLIQADPTAQLFTAQAALAARIGAEGLNRLKQAFPKNTAAYKTLDGMQSNIDKIAEAVKNKKLLGKDSLASTFSKSATEGVKSAGNLIKSAGSGILPKF